MSEVNENEFIIRRLLAEAKAFTEKEFAIKGYGDTNSKHYHRAVARVELIEHLKEQYLDGGKTNA